METTESADTLLFPWEFPWGYVLILFKDENDLSDDALVTGIVTISFAISST